MARLSSRNFPAAPPSCVRTKRRTRRWPPPITPCMRKNACARRLRGDIGKQTILDARDLIFELQLAFFQPRQLKLVAMGRRGDCRDSGVKIAMLLPEGGK